MVVFEGHLLQAIKNEQDCLTWERRAESIWDGGNFYTAIKVNIMDDKGKILLLGVATYKNQRDWILSYFYLKVGRIQQNNKVIFILFIVKGETFS